MPVLYFWGFCERFKMESSQSDSLQGFWGGRPVTSVYINFPRKTLCTKCQHLVWVWQIQSVEQVNCKTPGSWTAQKSFLNRVINLNPNRRIQQIRFRDNSRSDRWAGGASPQSTKHSFLRACFTGWWVMAANYSVRITCQIQQFSCTEDQMEIANHFLLHWAIVRIIKTNWYIQVTTFSNSKGTIVCKDWIFELSHSWWVHLPPCFQIKTRHVQRYDTSSAGP